MSSLLKPSRSTRACLDECGGLTYYLVDLASGFLCFFLTHKMFGHLTTVLILISDAAISCLASDSNSQHMAILATAWAPGNKKFGHLHPRTFERGIWIIGSDLKLLRWICSNL